jgi:solute carrier family 25 folate transporter 32
MMLWRIKIRCVCGPFSACKLTADGLKKIAKDEGFTGLYRGLIPSLFGVSHAALQFTAYEKLKDWRQKRLSDVPMVCIPLHGA